jgi:tyrosyl-tRNA synthetase
MATPPKNLMTLSEELAWRGMINQTTFPDLSVLDNKKLTFYKGFDASAPSQTVGNLAAMMVDLVFLRHGYKGIILAGGATSLIGDPGGKDKERPMQTIETINTNVIAAKNQIKKIYREHDFTLVNNIDWSKKINVLDFLRDVGKYFNIGEMVKKDYIATRIGEGGSGISYTEFSYSLLQGLDFLHLFQEYNCTLQIGGSDQWSNCLAGVELIRRKLGKEVNVITLPLIINKATGKKFGKSEEGAVWLDPELTSPYDFYQFWLNVDDESVKDYLKIYTSISKPEFDNLISEFEKDRSTRSAQKYLAFAVTELVHGTKEVEKVKATTEALFGKKVDLTNNNIPVIIMKSGVINLVDFLTEQSLLSSKREAREFIKNGSISINNEKVTTETINTKEFPKETLMRIGKKKHFKLKIV